MPDFNIIKYHQWYINIVSANGVLSWIQFALFSNLSTATDGFMKSACLVHCKRRGSNNTTAHRDMCNEKFCVEQCDITCCLGGQHLLVLISLLSNKIESHPSSMHQSVSACLHLSNTGQVWAEKGCSSQVAEKGILTTAFSCVKIFAVGSLDKVKPRLQD